MTKKIAVVSGGSSGIGAAVVDKLRSQNITVYNLLIKKIKMNTHLFVILPKLIKLMIASQKF